MRHISYFNSWRLFEPVLLGFFADLLVNIIFNPYQPGKWWSIEELIVAILFCVLITESNRFVEKKLESKYNWRIATKKRFIYQLFYITIILLFVVNIVGRLYHWIIGDEFYLLNEIVIINLIVFFTTLFLVTFKWITHFYRQWKTSDNDLKKATLKFEELASELKQSKESVKLQKKSSHFITNIQDIRIIEFGIVKVSTIKNDMYVFQGTLSKIASFLPEYLFFPVTRNMIVHHEQIISITSSTHGKILVKIRGINSEENDIIVSRLKASAFRKWYNSTSSLNL